MGTFITKRNVTGGGIVISGQTSGDVLYFDGTNWVRLAHATGDKVILGGTPPTTGTVSNAALAGSIALSKLTDQPEANATADQTDSEINTAYFNQVALASQAEAEAGTVTNNRRFTPERIKQAIDALSGGLWTVLGDYEATSAEGSHNFNFTAVDFDDDSKLVLVIDIGATLILNLQIRINTNSTANYYSDGRRIAGGSETLLDLNAQNEGQLVSSTLLGGANEAVIVFVEIGLSKAGSEDRVGISSKAVGTSIQGNEVMSTTLVGALSSLTDVEVRTSTSTWQIGTRMTLYKVAKA